jgi:hypothetical protein
VRQSLSAISALAALVAAPLWGHHSAAAEYDASKLLVLTGTVTKVEWTNPHVFFNLDVKSPSGKITNWRLEMASPNGLRTRQRRQGNVPHVRVSRCSVRDSGVRRFYRYPRILP